MTTPTTNTTDHLAIAATIVAEFEGCRLEAYRCPAGVWTIGIGTTRTPDGAPIRPGMRIDADTAEAWLRHDLEAFDRAVDRLVTVGLTVHQRAALVSFTYNVGVTAFAGSTLLRKLNAGDYLGAAAEFPRWNRAGGRVLAGLTRRRAAERALFLTPPAA
ncbi:lysozyme [Caenispirillum bisanense]|uniref:Lysozyme n=1 Tax=Caenispirillum bisanense TaxID=414052 RepID=A0A286GNA9_9PROT|nr:lysozyme [Caenispirillum bisanense]SOD97035.1 Phage-related lysozyme (muramidase), GH24 family [Caenispirillum bisanense]